MNQPTTPNTVGEIRELLTEAYGFKSTSPKAQENINAALDLLDGLADRTPAAPVVAEEKYLWSARTESDRTLLIDHHGAVIGGAVFPCDVLAIVNAHNERVRAAHPVAPAVVAEGLTTIVQNAYIGQTGEHLDAAIAEEIAKAVLAAHPVAGSPAEAVTLWRTKGSEPWLEARNEDADAMRKNPVFELRTLYTSPAAAAPMPASEAPTEYKPVGKFLYVGIGYEATSSDDPRGITLYRPTAAPVPASEAARVEAFEKMLAQDEVNRIADEAARRDRPAAFAAPAAPTDTKYNKE